MRREATVVLALACWAAACSGTGEPANDGRASTLADAPAAALTEVFGPGITLAQDRSPAVFHGDFNGDGQGDVIAFGRVDRSHDAIPSGVQVLQPWSATPDGAGGGLSSGAGSILAVVHGSSTAGSGGGFLLHDPAVASILDTEAAREAFVTDRAGASDLNAEVGRLARGDVFVLPTEAGIDSFLYWDGSAYRAFQPIEYP